MTAKQLKFQSSIAPKDDRNLDQLDRESEAIAALVSILDRPEGRSQPFHCPIWQSLRTLFQSSIAPKDDRNLTH